MQCSKNGPFSHDSGDTELYISVTLRVTPRAILESVNNNCSANDKLIDITYI